MLWVLALVLFVLWLLGFLVVHITSAAIHILLILALIAIVAHFLRGRGTTVG